MSVKRLITVVLVIAISGAAYGNEPVMDGDNRTVLGPRNIPLYDGAQELLDGDAEEGIRLTLLGLEAAMGRRERQAALSNLCAGYLLLDRYAEAIQYCDLAISENENNWRALSNRALLNVYTGHYDAARADLERGEQIAPNARSLKEVRGILLDHTDPVVPNIIVDDRRGGDDER